MAAPAKSHFAPRALNLRKDFGINDEFICSLMAIPTVFQAGRPTILCLAVAGQPRTFQIINKAEVTPRLRFRRDASR
jgi:hypothetical protein